MTQDFRSSFERAHWSGYEVLSWIAYGKERRIGKLNASRLQDIADFERHRMLYDKRPEVPPKLKRKNTWAQILHKNPKLMMAEPNFKHVLITMLLDGAITAYRDDGEELPPAFWINRRLSAYEWGNYYFLRQKVLAARPPETKHSKIKRSLNNAKTECERWFERLVASSPSQGRPYKKIELKKTALAQFRGLSGTAFEEIWASRAPAAWRGPGPPKGPRPIKTRPQNNPRSK
jgi:hypothetical protein